MYAIITKAMTKAPQNHWLSFTSGASPGTFVVGERGRVAIYKLEENRVTM